MANVSRARRSGASSDGGRTRWRHQLQNAVVCITARNTRRKTARTSGRGPCIITGIRSRRLNQPRPTAPAVRNAEAGHVRTPGNPGHTQHRRRIAEGTNAPGEADRPACCRRCSKLRLGSLWRWRVRAVPTIAWVIATAYGLALEVALGAAAVTGPRTRDGSSRRRSRSHHGTGEASARDAARRAG